MNRSMGNYTLRIKKSDAVNTVVFVLSFFHAAFLVVFFAYLLLGAVRNTKSGIRGLILIAMRTVLNPNIAVNTSTAQIVKWLTIFAISFIILLRNRNREKTLKVQKCSNRVAFFCVYVCFAALISSAYPVVSIFKCFSYGFVFYSILIGVGETGRDVDWAEVLYRYMKSLMLCSLVLSPFAFSYYSRNNWFMGMTNHSQMFGIMATLYLSLLLMKTIKEGWTPLQFFMLVGVAYLSFRSGSRTGMISALLCVLYTLYVEVIRKRKTYLLAVFLVMAGFVVLAFGNEAASLLRNVILKDVSGTSGMNLTLENITRSRQGQYETFLTKFFSSPLIGTGFMVPYAKGVRDFSFSFSLLVENGNLFYSVIGDLGILGLILFIITYGTIYLSGSKKQGRSLLFFAPLFINLGEMVFFITNNNAIILYVMIAAFLV